MSERVELILAAFFGNILAEVACYGYRKWQAWCHPRWKCPDCGLLVIAERDTLDMVRNRHRDQAGHGVQE